MTTLSITTACRRIAAAFGSERAQQKLAQQKSERSAITLLSIKSIDMDRMYPIPRFESALPGRISPTLQQVTTMLAPAKQLTPPPLRHVSEGARDTFDRVPKAENARQTPSMAPPQLLSTPSNTRLSTTTVAAPREGSWLHDHWKASPAGTATRSAAMDTTDAKTPAAATAAQEDTGSAGTFRAPQPVPSTVTPELGQSSTRKVTEEAPRTTSPAVPAGKPQLKTRSPKVLAHKDAIRAARRAEAEQSVAAPARPAPVLSGTQPIVVAQLLKAPAPPAPASALAPPPPPPLPQDVSPTRVDAPPGGLFAELKSRTLLKSKSLDDKATEAFGTRTGRASDTRGIASADVVPQGLIQPKRNRTPSLPSELVVAIEKRRKDLGETPAKTTVAADRPTAIPTQPKAADSAGTLIRPRPAATGPQLISKELKNSLFQELQGRLGSRPQELAQ